MEELNKILWDAIDDGNTPADKARARAAFARFRRRTGLGSAPAPKPVHSIGGWIVRIAACLALPLAALTVWLLSQTLHAEEWQETSAQAGQATEVVLADGTHVFLSGGSTVVYPAHFRGHDRQVFFSGEGYFEVKADAAHPFNVLTGDARLTVLGTKFNVKAYTEDNSVSVTLDEGRLTFSSTSAKGTAACDMVPGDKVTFNRATGQLSKTYGDTDAGQWRNGMFYFKNEPLGEIARSIERHFGVRVFIENEALISQRYHMALVNGETIDDFVRILALDTDLDVQRNGSIITIR